MNTIANVREFLFKQKQERKQVALNDFRDIVIWAADKENGGRDGSIILLVTDETLEEADPDVDVDKIIGVMEAGNFSMDDLAKNVELKKRRDRLFVAHQDGDRRKAALDDLEKRYVAENLAETKRHQEMRKHLDELREQRDAALRSYNESEVARGDLFATSAPSDESLKLHAAFMQLTKQIGLLEESVNPSKRGLWGNDQPTPGDVWPNVNTHPAAHAAQCKRALDDEKAPLSKSRRDQLTKQLAAAQAIENEKKAELAAARKKLDVVREQLAAAEQDRYRPENFAIVRAKPSPDDARKEHAKRFGYGPEPVSGRC